MGSFMPYKNVETLIRGMAELPDFTLNLLSRITPERRGELEALVPAGATVVFHNGVTDAEYDEPCCRTTALVTLSKAEGYGLPLVEAMALGTPVVAATRRFSVKWAARRRYVPADSPSGFAAAVRNSRTPTCGRPFRAAPWDGRRNSAGTTPPGSWWT